MQDLELANGNLIPIDIELTEFEYEVLDKSGSEFVRTDGVKIEIVDSFFQRNQ